MEENHSKSRTQLDGMSDVVLQLLMSYIDDPKDRDAVSLICKRWYELDAQSRKHVTIALCYTTTPDRLRRRFPHLESLKLKGKPRAAMFNLIPEDWGGYVAPWVKAISESFSCLRSLHFRRMVVSDEDLELLAKSRGKVLVSLKLDKCCGFSTDGLLHLTRSCSNIRTFFLEESLIKEHDGKWLHELAQNNTVLENLNFYLTYLNKVSIEDLELIARNCRSLVSVKISECEILEHVQFLGTAAALEEFCGASTEPADAPDRYSVVTFPPRLCRLGFTYMGKNEMSIVFPIAALLKKLDLLFAMLDTEDHCLLIQRCPNLEVLETRNVIGDRGLETLAQNCNKLKRLRIERGADEPEDVEGRVSQRGLTALAQGCLELEYLAVYASDITNESLESLGKHLKKLSDFRLVLLDGDVNVIDSPLDNGVRALLMGCKMLKRFALYLQPGGLTDVGLGYVGQYSPNVRWMLLGNVGESDMGLSEFARGCPSLQKLEMRGCLFSERALALAVMQLSSLRYLWVQGYVASPTGQDLMAMARPFWNIEVIPARQVSLGNEPEETVVVEQPAQILAYYSLAGARDDCPPSVIPLDPVQVVNS